MTENEKNKIYAEKLSKLILDHPNLRVIAWIDTDGINDDYSCMAGYLYEPCIETIVIGHDDLYRTKDGNAYEDCYHYYGWECDEWSDEELEEKARAIPWEDVIAIRVGAT